MSRKRKISDRSLAKAAYAIEMFCEGLRGEIARTNAEIAEVKARLAQVQQKLGAIAKRDGFPSSWQAAATHDASALRRQ